MVEEQEIQAQKEKYLRELIDANPAGFPLSEARDKCLLAYPTIKKLISKWGYKIVKKKIYTKRTANIIVKDKEVDQHDDM